ncbi:hypothetical protein H4217_008023 [Coemansia sp. RSA 1939]|nr:hypothetical protein H4217_008023 [Coemansia sp. RSA 1939]KAJ2595219.1 hypothetical protein EV177_008186 [Coemansia sp. RSA 1804]
MRNYDDQLMAGARWAAWIIAAKQLTITVLVALFTNNCLDGHVYDAQIARHVFILPWLIILAYSLKPGHRFEEYFKIPDNRTAAFILVGAVYFMVMLATFSDDMLSVLQPGGAGIDPATVGKRCRPPFAKPKVLFLVVIILNSLTGTAGIFWILVAFFCIGE